MSDLEMRIEGLVEEIAEATTMKELTILLQDAEDLATDPRVRDAASKQMARFVKVNPADIPPVPAAPAAADEEMVLISKSQLRKLVSLAEMPGARVVSGTQSTTGRSHVLYRLHETSELRVHYNPNSGACPKQAVVLASILLTYFANGEAFSESDLFEVLDAHNRDVAPTHPDPRRARAVWKFYRPEFLSTKFIQEL